MEKESGRVNNSRLYVIVMKVIMLMIKNMGLGYLPGLVVTYTKENTKMMKEMVLEK